MPTKRRRHAVTETPPVQAALDELRGELGEDRIQLGELVILGANAKLEQLRERQAEQTEKRRRITDRIRRREPLADRAAAEEVRRTGWARG